MEFVQQLMDQIKSLTAQNALLETQNKRMVDQVESFTATIAELNQTIKEL